MALIGLMSIQVYWIRNAIVVKQAGFVRSVNEAIPKVVLRLEKIEMVNKFNTPNTVFSDQKSYTRYLDSINEEFKKDIANIKTAREYEAFNKKSRMLSRDITSVMKLRRKPIEERINENLLDSLINFELAKSGINTVYEYGIYSPYRNQMVMQKTGTFPNKLLSEESFHFTLFPSDIQGIHPHPGPLPSRDRKILWF